MNRDQLPETEAPTTTDETAELNPKKVESEKPENGDDTQELGGPRGPEPTRFGDWERKGRCIDF